MRGEPELAEAAPRRPRAGDRVSQAADRLFYTRGIRAVGVDEIVAQAGVTKPSLYRSFGSKDELVVACLGQRFATKMARVDALEAAFADPVALVRALVASIAAEIGSEDFRGCPITNAAVEFPEEDHPTRLRALALKRAMRARLHGICARLPTDRPDELGDALVLLFEGAHAVRHTSSIRGPGAALTAAADALLRGFLSADQKPGGSAAGPISSSCRAIA